MRKGLKMLERIESELSTITLEMNNKDLEKEEMRDLLNKVVREREKEQQLMTNPSVLKVFNYRIS